MTWIQANPGKLVVGVGTRFIRDDFFWRKLMKDRGISVKIVTYQGGGEQLLATLGGHSDTGGASTATFMPYKGTGKLIPLLWLDSVRHPAIPDVPTAIEEGSTSCPGIGEGSWPPRARRSRLFRNSWTPSGK